MIPVFPAIILEDKKELMGGTTKPLLISVDTGNGMEKYVVKVFSNRQQQQYAPLAKEVYANLIARQFDIKVPEMALISFNSRFIKTLPFEIKERVRVLEIRHHFATKYYDGFVQFIQGTHRRTFDMYDVETIFAFDVLIRNIDRRIGKSNLLIKRDNYLAIDHELSLLIANTFGEYSRILDWDFIRNIGNPHRQHIFLNRLHRIRNRVGFDTFFEHLRTSNFNSLLDAAEFLNSFHIPVGEIENINSYLYDVKNNPNTFSQILKYLIA